MVNSLSYWLRWHWFPLWSGSWQVLMNYFKQHSGEHCFWNCQRQDNQLHVALMFGKFVLKLKIKHFLHFKPKCALSSDLCHFCAWWCCHPLFCLIALGQVGTCFHPLRLALLACSRNHCRESSRQLLVNHLWLRV